jgi:hypothetical protein
MSADDPAAQYIESRPLARSRAGSREMKTYRKLLEDCQSHDECNEAMKKVQGCVAPGRLFCTQPDSNKLLQTIPQGESLSYVALSYCWGDAQQMEKAKTTRANVQDRHRRIELSQLPQTIRDAIEVTRSLGLVYLWVDALCIIQDDPEDCATEMAKMASIYLGATITISATSAKDCKEGFLGDRDLASAYGSLFRLSFCGGDDGVRGSMLLSEHPICDTNQEPIDERAWTMQEHHLSLRLIRFGSKQTTWKCLTDFFSIDGGSTPHPTNKDTIFSIDESHRVTEVQSRIKESGGWGKSVVLSHWLEGISEYTNRKLSKSSDKLPACAALAESVANTLGWGPSNYLAGLWENDIQAQLLWFRREGMKAERISGPTWSWASLDGPVTFFQRQFLEYAGEVNARATLKKSIIIHKIEGQKYFEVESGRLWLNGRLQQAHWDGDDLRRSMNSPRVLPFKPQWDAAGSIGPRIVWCFEIIGSHVSLGLMLDTMNGTDFERVGYFDCGRPEYGMTLFDGVEPRTIILH